MLMINNAVSRDCLIVEHPGIFEVFSLNENLACLALVDVYYLAFTMYPESVYRTDSENLRNVLLSTIEDAALDSLDPSVLMPTLDVEKDILPTDIINDYLDLCYKITQEMDLSYDTYLFIHGLLNNGYGLKVDLASVGQVIISGKMVTNGTVMPTMQPTAPRPGFCAHGFFR